MRKRSVMLTCMLFLGYAGTSEATPPQSPDIMSVAEAVLPGDAEKTAPASPGNTDHLVAILIASPEIKSISDLTNKSIAIDAGRSGSSADVRTAIAAAGATEVELSQGQTRAIHRLISGEVSAAVLTLAYPEAAEWSPEIAGFKVFRMPLSPPPSPARPESTADAAAVSRPRTIHQQVTAATALAEQVTGAVAVPAPEQNANNAADKTAAVLPNTANPLVVLLMAWPEIKSVSDLTNKSIAIDDRQRGFSGSVQAAIAAAGVTKVQLSEGQTKAIDRLIGGEVPAAILGLVSPQAAEWFPDIAGFKVLRIPLSPPTSNARTEPATKPAARADAKLDANAAVGSNAGAIQQQVTAAAASDTARARIPDQRPAGSAAANANSRKILEQVAAATALAEYVTATVAVPTPEQQANKSAEKIAPLSPNNAELLVVLLMARPEIKSVSDLASKNVAIDVRQSASIGSVRTAIAAAGATEVQLSEGKTKAIDRLISAEVPAAVVALVSPEAAEWFPEVAGFKIFRVPLSPRSSKAPL
jgi:TRAP-type uncharacterized transport system substrate-binding protein